MVARFDAAEVVLRRALRLLDGMPDVDAADSAALRARVLTSLSFTTLVREGKPQSLDLLRQARRLARGARADHVVALTHVQEAAIHGTTGDWSAALRAADRGAARSDVLTAQEHCSLLINRGLLNVIVMHLDAARSDLDHALGVARATGLPVQEFKALHNLGCVEYFAGNLPEALRLMRSADAMEVEVSRARAKLDHAAILLDAGLVEQADDKLKEALRSARREHLRMDEGDIHLDLVRCALLRNDRATARKEAGAAVRAFVSRGVDDRHRYALIVRAAVDVAAGATLDAGTEATLAPATGRPLTTPEDRFAARVVAEGRLLRGDVDGARVLVDRLGRGRQASIESALHERLVRARLAAAEGDPGSARRAVRVASRVLAARQHLVPSLDIRAGLALHGRRLAEFDLDLAMGTGRVSAVFASLERWRAVSQHVTPIAPPHDPGLATLLAELRRTRSLATGGSPDSEHLRAQAARLQAEIAQLDWSRVSGRHALVDVRPACLASAQRAAADSGSTLLVYFDHDARLHRLRITSRSAQLDTLGPTAAVQAAVARARRDALAHAHATAPALHQAIARALRSSLADVDNALFGDAGASGRALRGPGRPAVVIPTRAMTSLPWGLLPSLAGRPVVVASSVTRWVRDTRAATATERPPVSVAALAGPGLDRAPCEATAIHGIWAGTPAPAAQTSPAQTSLTQTPHTQARAPGPAGDRTVGTALASSTDVVAALGRATLVHLAAHGTHEDQNPLFSSLRMSDGPVFAHEFPRPVVAAHVVLSACDVGRSRSRPGGETLGLTAALLSLGARSIVAAVTPVADEAADRAMRIYHHELFMGRTAAEALAVTASEIPQTGAFCVFGADWRPPGPPT